VEERLELPSGVEATLSVITGPEKGHSLKLDKSRTIIGRKGADFALDDPEISRQHCLLEVRDGFVNLKDLDSTNGTFFEEERVRAAVLQDGAEFRVGSTLIRLSFRSKE